MTACLEAINLLSAVAVAALGLLGLGLGYLIGNTVGTVEEWHDEQDEG